VLRCRAGVVTFGRPGRAMGLGATRQGEHSARGDRRSDRRLCGSAAYVGRVARVTVREMDAANRVANHSRRVERLRSVADFVDSTVREIDQRLRALQEEVRRLEAARAALTGGLRGPGRPPKSGSASRPRRQRARRAAAPRGRRSRNTRATQALEAVRARPGITTPQLAEALKIQPNYLYRVMPRLVADGQVKRDGRGWRLAE
jgi:hypothetical protein